MSIYSPAAAVKVAPQPQVGPRVFVIGNEKGGTGKSTVAVNLVVGLLRSGQRVACIDIDARQATLGRYMANRRLFAARHGVTLPFPTDVILPTTEGDSRADAEAEDQRKLAELVAELGATHDSIVIDTPGRNDHMTRLAHSHADVLITPINDSHIDLDLIATLDPATLKVLKPSIYSDLVWEQRKQRALWRRPPLEWIVMLNRVRQVDSKNAREIESVLKQLAPRFRFQIAPGFGERTIFREMFQDGLTLLDMREAGIERSLSMSHVAARNEIRILMEMLGYGLS
jgi:chromosome partitioning protein